MKPHDYGKWTKIIPWNGGNNREEWHQGHIYPADIRATRWFDWFINGIRCPIPHKSHLRHKNQIIGKNYETSRLWEVDDNLPLFPGEWTLLGKRLGRSTGRYRWVLSLSAWQTLKTHRVEAQFPVWSPKDRSGRHAAPLCDHGRLKTCLPLKRLFWL